MRKVALRLRRSKRGEVIAVLRPIFQSGVSLTRATTPGCPQNVARRQQPQRALMERQDHANDVVVEIDYGCAFRTTLRLDVGLKKR